MIGEITGSRLKELAYRATGRRYDELRPSWCNDNFYIVARNGMYLKKVPAGRLHFSSQLHHYFDNYFYAWACYRQIKDKRHEEPDSA